MQLLGNRGRMGSNMAFLDSPSLCQPVEKKSKYKTQGTNIFSVRKEYHLFNDYVRTFNSKYVSPWGKCFDLFH